MHLSSYYIHLDHAQMFSFHQENCCYPDRNKRCGDIQAFLPGKNGCSERKIILQQPGRNFSQEIENLPTFPQLNFSCGPGEVESGKDSCAFQRLGSPQSGEGKGTAPSDSPVDWERRGGVASNCSPLSSHSGVPVKRSRQVLCPTVPSVPRS